MRPSRSRGRQRDGLGAGRHRRLVRLDRHPDARRRSGPSAAATRSWRSASARRSTSSSPRPSSSGRGASPSATRRDGPRSPPPLPFATVVDDLADLVDVADVVVNAVVGFAGLPVTIATLRPASGWRWRTRRASSPPGPSCSRCGRRRAPSWCPSTASTARCTSACARRPMPSARSPAIVLTASGGPFRGRTADDLADVGVEQALAHPTWQMGPKITIDSSTLMNKGLEVIEAHELFGTPYDQIEVVVHPQSIVHSMVEFTDGSTIAQLSMPDMRLPDRLRPRATRPGSARRSGASTGRPRHARLRAARHGDVPLPDARLRGRTRRRQRPGVAERGQRGRRRGLPRRRDPLASDR